MKRVTGIGGIFFKARDPAMLRDWYRRHLGMDIQDWGGMSFQWAPQGENAAPEPDGGATVWSIFDGDTDYFAPSTAPFMINYRVHDLQALIAVLRSEGCTVDDKVQDTEFGKFSWVMDPEGNRVELWQPPVSQPASAPDGQVKS